MSNITTDIKTEFTEKTGKYYNLWKGEISGQLSDGAWENEPYQRYGDRFVDELIPYVGDRMLILGVAQKLGMNIHDDPWITAIAWIYFSMEDDPFLMIDHMKSHSCKETLNNYLQKTTEEGDKYWIEKAQSMMNNKEKVELIWNCISNEEYTFDTLSNDVNEINDVYDDNIFII